MPALDPIMKGQLLKLTRAERATYQALRARGWAHDYSLGKARAGVDVETAKQWPMKEEN